jgi:hypothetical protein
MKHNAVERRRKKAIKEAMDELVDMLPEKQNKPTQLSVLKAAIDYIKQLQQENDTLRGRTPTSSASQVPVKRQRVESHAPGRTFSSSSDADLGTYSGSSSDDEAPVTNCFAPATQQPVLQLPVYSVTAPTMYSAPPPSNTTTFVPPMLSGSFLQFLHQSDVTPLTSAPQCELPPQQQQQQEEDDGARALNFLPASLLTANAEVDTFSGENSSTSSACSFIAQSGGADFEGVLARFLSADETAFAN